MYTWRDAETDRLKAGIGGVGEETIKRQTGMSHPIYFLVDLFLNTDVVPFALKIKNSVRTAQALAVNKNEKLSMEHLNLVLAVTEGFEHDLKGTGQLESTKPPWYRNAATNTTNNSLIRYDVLCVKIFCLAVMQKAVSHRRCRCEVVASCFFLVFFPPFFSFSSLLGMLELGDHFIV